MVSVETQAVGETVPCASTAKMSPSVKVVSGFCVVSVVALGPMKSTSKTRSEPAQQPLARSYPKMKSPSG